MKKFLVEISARHIHLSREHLDVLYGEGYALTNKKDLSQPGQYACEEKVLVKGPKGELNMSILGPVRSNTQVEVSFTDARSLGIKAPLRESGDIKGSAGTTLVGPKGTVTLEEGVIVAKRHIHLTPSDATEYNVTNGQIVDVAIDSEGRSLVFKDTVVRVREDFAEAMHIDTDEANACGISGSAMGYIVK